MDTKKKSIVNRLEELRCNKGLEPVHIAKITNIWENQVYVNCPFCNKTHRHGYTNDSIQFRAAHCCGKDYFYDPTIYYAMRG